jgi:crotonobetainyl-CoA:carnitine CoA-transferase CaiB-like acyl-CoA transferase
MAQVGLPFAPNGATEPAAARPAPQLGEHTTELLFELGYDDERVAALRRAGVV